MDLYLDKENLESLMMKNSHDLFNDILKLIKNQLGVYLNFRKEDAINNEALIAFFKLSTAGTGATTMTFLNDNVFPARPLKSNSANAFDKGQIFSILLVNDDDNSKLKNTGSILIGSVGEEIEIFRQIFLFLDDYLFDRELRIGSLEFNSWDCLIPYATPLTDIIIIDPYIFKNGEPEPETIDVNLVKWLCCLCEKVRTKVNIVIVYNPSQVNYELEQIKKKIVVALEAVLGKKPLVTFISTYKEHDRTIITNYIRITGNSFTYWSVSGRKITKGKEVVIKSLARREYHTNALEAISDVQKILDDNSDGSSVFGDKISNILSFS